MCETPCGFVPWLLIDLKGSGVNDLDRVWGLIYLRERKDVSAPQDTTSLPRDNDVRPRKCLIGYPRRSPANTPAPFSSGEQITTYTLNNDGASD